VVEARVGCAERASFCGISRILFSLFARRRSFVSLGCPSAQLHPAPLSGFRRNLFLLSDLKAALGGAGCDYYPRGFSRIRGKSGQATLPLLCLAPHGVFHAAPLTRMPGGLLPRLFTLTRHHPAPFPGLIPDRFLCYTWKWCWMVPGGIFSVTLSVTQDSRPGRPRFRGACCLPVFGLSSGPTTVKPATARHGPENNMNRSCTPVSVSPESGPTRPCRFYDETREICASFPVPFPGGSGRCFQEKTLARTRKTNIVHAPPRLAKERVVLPERLF
jgi:hypothetical protein